MKILILNWRDFKSPFAGGAERFTFEHARRWVKAGCEVTWFASDFGNCPKEEVIEGIKIIRRGTEITVPYHAFRYYKKFFRNKFDLVIEEINTMPFLTPLYIRGRKVTLFHQLAKEIWFYETFFPLSLIGFIFEYFYLKIYRDIPAITISESTKKDLFDLGFREEIYLLPQGIAFKPLIERPPKAAEPTLIYVGRLRRSKRVHHIIQAMTIIKKTIPNIRLHIVGSESKAAYANKINSLIDRYKLRDNVVFHGFTDEATKKNLLKEAHALVVASVREGWAVVVSEANALFTIAIGYNIRGLRDSIRDGRTGILTKKNNTTSLAEAILEFFANADEQERLSKNASEWVKDLTWDRSAEESLKLIRILAADNK